MLMHLAKCGWANATSRNSIQLAHVELGNLNFFAAQAAQLHRRLTYTAGQHNPEKLRATAEGETATYGRKDAKGIPSGTVPDLAVNRLLLDNKFGEQLSEFLPHLEGPLVPISHRRLEVIMTRAIRTQVRLSSAQIETP